MLKKKHSAIILAIALSLTACGSSDNSQPPPVEVLPYTGKVVDGYLAGATVACDLNNNGNADTGEPTATTGVGGVFTFAAGCDFNVVATGGNDATTTFPFLGLMRATTRSPIISPLTTLLVGTGMTSAQLVTALGLPAGTDVTRVDPFSPGNEDLLRTMLAVQQIVSELAEALGPLAGSTNLRALYKKVGTSLVATLLANPGTPLFNADNSINQTVLNAVARASVTALNADPAFTPFTITDGNLFAAAEQVGHQAEQFMVAPLADLGFIAKELQDPNAPPLETHAATNYLSLTHDAVMVNGNEVTLAAIASAQGATINTPTTLGLNFAISGTPEIDNVVSVGLEFTEIGGSSRVLQIMIDRVNMKNTGGQLSIVPDAAAKVYVYGHTASTANINLTLNDLSFQPLSITNNALSLNYANIVNKVLASADNNTQTTAHQFINIKGKFSVKIAMAGTPMRTFDGAHSLNDVNIDITNMPQGVAGIGAAGTLTIQ